LLKKFVNKFAGFRHSAEEQANVTDRWQMMEFRNKIYLICG